MVLMLTCIFLSVLALSPAVLSVPEAVTSQGRLIGHTLLSRDGKEYNAFNGIPYAQPPVGNLRFMPPQPGTPWNGVLNATVTRPFCYQKPFLVSQHGIQGQEDCLYLDVYTPKMDASYPVMVYVHGGAFTYGWPGTPMKPSYFMDEEVIIVTLTYRLGYLGFLSLEDDVLPGNYGLKDQVLALQWVKNEINNFGGNPNLITAFGISAGGASSHYLCSIPKAREILKGCISQSGVGGAIWSLHAPGDAREMAIDLGKKIGCEEYSNPEFVTCLQSKPLESFIPSASITQITKFSAPVIEQPSDTALLTEWPSSNSDFPWIAGVVENEGLLITGYLKAFGTVIEKMGLIFGGDLLLIKALHLKDDVVKDLYKINKRFFKWKNFFHIFNDFEKLLTEGFWVYPLLTEFMRHTGPKFFYRFEYAGGPSLWEMVANKSLEVDGICHGDDAPYYFNLSNYYYPEGWPQPEDTKMSRTLVKMWVNFATHQDPNIGNVQWDQFGEYASYLEITNSGLAMKNYTKFQDVIDFWSSLK